MFVFLCFLCFLFFFSFFTKFVVGRLGTDLLNRAGLVTNLSDRAALVTKLLHRACYRNMFVFCTALRSVVVACAYCRYSSDLRIFGSRKSCLVRSRIVARRCTYQSVTSQHTRARIPKLSLETNIHTESNTLSWKGESLLEVISRSWSLSCTVQGVSLTRSLIKHSF